MREPERRIQRNCKSTRNVAAPLCRPSLASMATGLYPFQHGITGNDVDGRNRRAELDVPMRAGFHKHPSFIKLLTSNGYLAHQSGKWWEGSFKDGGFTHGMTHGDLKRGGRHGDAGLKIGRDSMKPVTDFIDQATEENKPFLLWYAPFLPHTPHNPPKRLLDEYIRPGRAADVARYYAINLLDENARADRKAVFGVCNSTHNMTSGNPDATLQYLWCVEGDWKFLLRYDGKDTTEYHKLHNWDTAPVRLYNLKSDPHEENELSSSRPEIAQRLRTKIETWHPVDRK